MLYNTGNSRGRDKLASQGCGGVCVSGGGDRGGGVAISPGS